MKRLTRTLQDALSRLHYRACLILFFAFLGLSSQAFAADHIEVRPIGDISLGEWSGSGGMSRSVTSCISSANTTSFWPWGGSTKPYQVTVEDLDSSGRSFYLYLDGNSSNKGNKRITVSISHRDAIEGSGYERLRSGTRESDSHNGQFRYCFFSGSNSELKVDIDSGDMSGKVSGYYEGSFRLTARGGDSGSATDTNDFRISISLQGSTEVQINGLDNISLGTHAGLGNIYAEENFCVYSTISGGGYTLTISSVNQDGAGEFYLDGGGLGQIPYDLYFIASGSGPGTNKVGSGSLSAVGDDTNQYCGGGNNATLSVNVIEKDLQLATSGKYTDSLIILVEPQ